MSKQKVNIDKMVDTGKCPEPKFCTVATTGYTGQEREHICYECWLSYCKRKDIEIEYSD